MTPFSLALLTCMYFARARKSIVSKVSFQSLPHCQIVSFCFYPTSNKNMPPTRRRSTRKLSVPMATEMNKSESKKRPKTSNSDSKEGHETEAPASDANEARPWYHIFTKGDGEYDRYMATEWGFEKRGNMPLFEKISLEGAQSGLSWLTILRKRESYRRVFHNFDIDKCAAMTSVDVDRILAEEDKENPRNIIVRHKGKIESVINNAQCIQRLLTENPDKPEYFDELIWSFVDDKPILNTDWDGKNLQSALTQSEESRAMSKTLKSLGFRFVGPTTMYAFMQSCGLIIDHPVHSPEWVASHERLEERPGGYQERQK